ncbi:MAG: HEAT repeat domain-containing protein [bacterium]
MKKQFVTILGLVLLFAVSITAAENLNKKITNEQIEENLLVGLQSDNLGLRVSSAYLLGEIKPSEKAILLLMKTLRDDPDPRAKTMAALTLVKLEDERGLFLVQSQCKFSQDCKVRKMCQHLYASYLSKKQGALKETRDTLFASITNLK